VQRLEVENEKGGRSRAGVAVDQVWHASICSAATGTEMIVHLSCHIVPFHQSPNTTFINPHQCMRSHIGSSFIG